MEATMCRTFFLTSILVLAACSSTTTTPPPATGPTQLPAPQRSANALTPVASMPRTITPPSIRVGLLVDQPEVVFPRTADGYYVVTNHGPSTLRRGFKVRAPLADASVRYAVQMAAISDQSSAQSLAEKIRTDTGMRVDY